MYMSDLNKSIHALAESVETYDRMTDETIAEIGASLEPRLNKAGRPFGQYGPAPRMNPCSRCGIDIETEGDGKSHEFKNTGEIWCTPCYDEVTNSPIPMHA